MRLHIGRPTSVVTDRTATGLSCRHLGMQQDCDALGAALQKHGFAINRLNDKEATTGAISLALLDLAGSEGGSEDGEASGGTRSFPLTPISSLGDLSMLSSRGCTLLLLLGAPWCDECVAVEREMSSAAAQLALLHQYHLWCATLLTSPGP